MQLAKKKFLNLQIIALFLALFLTAGNITYAALSVITINSPYLGYVLQGEATTVSANVTNAPTSVKYYWNNTLKGTMSLASGSTYTYSWTPSGSDAFRGVYNSAYGVWNMSTKSKITASNLDGTSQSEVNNHVSIMTRPNYISIDSSFSHSSPASNTFLGVSTPDPAIYSLTYNCLAYAVNVNNEWMNPPAALSDVTKFMKKQSPYASRAGTTYTVNSGSFEPWQTKVIYYNASGGHFAKVVEYDASGYAKTLYSKWGQAELMKSTKVGGTNPFQNGIYGAEAQYYR